MLKTSILLSKWINFKYDFGNTTHSIYGSGAEVETTVKFFLLHNFNSTQKSEIFEKLKSI